ncbi:glycosyltransferase [Spirosoma sordidisoli]|uniref:Glycosyltransferase n=1 Tax=Spirosoma sordidisoli TaxID=2502893 RepID=A0A4Q2UWV6_9BACT|nr:glycosyltransferase [Spirosoma sordidisoli]RYC71479.1 glycosyltransferase [Spirosoma sordidisoli]
MRVLQIHNQYKEWGGEDAVVANEHELLTKAGHQVTRIEVRNSTVNSLFSDRHTWYSSLKHFLDNNSVDVAHIHNIYSVIGNSVYELLDTYKIPMVQTLHNYRFLCANGCLLDTNNKVCQRCARGNMAYGVMKKCYRGSYAQSAFMAWQIQEGRSVAQRYVSKFIAVSEFVKQKYEEFGFSGAQIAVKPNFASRAAITKPVCDKGYALYMGRLSPEKGVGNLVRVFSDIKYPLKIVGDGPLREELQQLAYGADNIEFLGYVQGEEKEQVLRECSFVIVPSEWFETFGMVVQEAYRYGKVVLASKIGALPHHVQQANHLFDPGSYSGLYTAVTSQLNKKDEGLPRNTTLDSDWAVTDAVSQLLKIYETVQR